jgi:hypothetical protein
MTDLHRDTRDNTIRCGDAVIARLSPDRPEWAKGVRWDVHHPRTFHVLAARVTLAEAFRVAEKAVRADARDVQEWGRASMAATRARQTARWGFSTMDPS